MILQYHVITILTNIIIQFIGKVIMVLLGLATVAVLTRYLGSSGYGNYSIILAIVSIFTIISDFGINITLIKSLTQIRIENRVSYAIFHRIKTIFSTVTLLLLLGILYWMPYELEIKIGILVGISGALIGSYMGYGYAILQTEVRIGTITIIDICTKTIIVMLTIGAIYLKLSLNWLIATILIGNSVGLMATFLTIPSHARFWKIQSQGLLLKTIRSIILIGCTSLFSSLYFKIDTILLSMLGTNEDVGIYSLSYKIFEQILMVWGFYMATGFPLLSTFFGTQRIKDIVRLLRTTYITILVLSFGIIVLGLIFGPYLIIFLGGNSFELSLQPFRILLFAIPLLFLNNVLYHISLLTENSIKILSILILSLLGNAFLNILFIPVFSYNGSAVITVITEIFITVSYIYILRPYKSLLMLHEA